MALMKSQHVPEDAVTVSEVEATTYVWELVNNWENRWDTWALRYSAGILGTCSALSGMYINRFYRNKFKLGTYGYLSSMIPISVLPGMLTAIFHRHAVTTGVLLMKNEGCPICFEMRSSAIQLGCGLVYPLILGPTSALMFANRHGTYRIPDLLEGPRVMFKFLRKVSKPFGGSLVFIGTMHCVASSVLTYFEMKNNFTLRRKVIELENKLMNEQPPPKQISYSK